jgi:hypothetical protein
MKKILFLFLLTAAFISCRKEEGPDFGKASLTFRLTDAPAAYDKVNIDIIGMEVIIDDSVINLDVNGGVYNLLDLVNGKDTLLVEQDVPAGRISQVRLILGDNNSIVVNGEVNPLKTPSAQQSGLKLNVDADFEPGIAYEYTIDFDAARSVVETGNDKYILKPVLRVITESVSGALKGIVYPIEARPSIFAINENLDSISTFADTLNGRFMFSGLPQGVYSIGFKPVAPFSERVLTNVQITNGVVTVLDTVKFE